MTPHSIIVKEYLELMVVTPFKKQKLLQQRFYSDEEQVMQLVIQQDQTKNLIEVMINIIGEIEISVYTLPTNLHFASFSHEADDLFPLQERKEDISAQELLSWVTDFVSEQSTIHEKGEIL